MTPLVELGEGAGALDIKRTWLQSIAPTLHAVTRLYHLGISRYCPGQHDDRCCQKYSSKGRTRPQTCVGVKWNSEDPEYLILKIIKISRELQSMVAQGSVEKALPLALQLGSVVRDYEIQFFKPENVDRVAAKRSDPFYDRRHELDTERSNRVGAVDRAMLSGISVSAAWDVAATSLGCSRSTIRRAWEQRNVRGITD